MTTEDTAIEVRPQFTNLEEKTGDVIGYIEARKRTPLMRVKVLARFDRIISQVVDAGTRRIKGMRISEAVSRGNALIKEADYYFLKELRNVPKGEFLSTLFDDPLKN